MYYKSLIDYLNNIDGIIPKDKTWYSIGVEFGIESPDINRANTDEDYRIRSIGRKTQDIWRYYTKSKESLSLVKETYKDKKLMYETFKKKESEISFNKEDFEIEKITTNPSGGTWTKFVKKDTSFNENHINNILSILEKNLKINPVNYVEDEYFNTKNTGLFIYGADKHIGALTKDNSIYKNDYDKEEIKKRIISKTLENICFFISNCGIVEDLFIMDLGDALDGYNQQTTRKAQDKSTTLLPQQLNNREQFDFYLEVHKELFDIIVENRLAKNIYYIATSNSNHGGDFEYMAMKTLELYLNTKYPFIKTHVTPKFINHIIYGNHCIIFSHGKDTEDLKGGFPLFLDNKTELYINEYIRNNKLEEYEISFISADLHQSSEYYSKQFRYKKVLSQYGSSKWIHTNFGNTLPGLSSELFFKNSSCIIKYDNRFKFESISNTGINI